MLSLLFSDFATGGESFAWDGIVQAASKELLLPALLERIGSLGLEKRVPLAVREVLAAAEEMNGERNREFVRESVSIAGRLNEVGITPVALKGVAYLLSGTFGDVANRYLADVDLLIPSGQLERAAACLAGFGYLENESAVLVELRHHYPALRRDGGPQIELHHRIGQGVCDRLLPAADMIARAKPLTVEGSRFLIPSATDVVTHLIIHSQLAHPYADRIFPPLRALVDLFQLQKRFGGEIDWHALSDNFTRHGEYATLALHLKQAQHTLGIETPATPAKLPLLLTIRWYRRLLLNRYPKLRFLDPIYWVMALFSRRLRLVPAILRQPKSWPQVMRAVMRGEF